MPSFLAFNTVKNLIALDICTKTKGEKLNCSYILTMVFVQNVK